MNSLIGLLLITGLPQLSLANVGARDCAIALEAGQQSLKRFNGVRFSPQKVVNGQHSGKRIFLRPRWNDGTLREIEKKIPKITAESAERAPEDFHNFVRDDAVEEFFGFSHGSPDGTPHQGGYVPDVVELNGAIDKINEGLSKTGGKPLPIRYYSTVGKIDAKDFLRSFAYKGELPIAAKGHFFIHDITTHISIIFLPNELTNLARAQVRAIFGFENYLRSTNLKLHTEIDWQSLYKEISENIDFGNGNAPIEMVADLENFGWGRTPGITEYVSDFKTPAEFIKSHAIRHKYGPQSFLAPPERREEILATIRAIIDEINNFSKQASEADVSFSQPQKLSLEEIRMRTEERILEISGVVKKH